MTSAVGKIIQKYLLEGKTPAIVAQKLLARNTKKPEAFLDICRFLYLTGQNQLLLKVTCQQLRKTKIVSWAFLIDMLTQQKIDLSKQTKMLFIKAIKQQDQMFAVLGWRAWDLDCPELKTLRQEEIQKINQSNNADFIQLMEDLRFIQAQGILKKEEDILKKLQTHYPQNPRIHELWLEFKEKWGRHIIQKKKEELLKKKLPHRLVSATEKAQVEKITDSILKTTQKDSQCVYDMAVFFTFIGWPQKALKILKTTPLSSQAEWLYLELVLQSRLYVECLHFLDKLDQQKKDDPETVFALTYARAIALHGLGKKQKAYKILSELQEVRPHYRLTHSLLKQWEKQK